MDKDYKNWHLQKQSINLNANRPFYHDREIWWCSVGINVGFEQDGKGRHFSRPILVFKKFNREVFLGLPLTTQTKTGKFYSSIILPDNTNRIIILSQIRLFDSKRLQEKMYTLDSIQFEKIKKTLFQIMK